jgi:UDP-3-O-[3-hydroxymyristoyl] glucosamine N-acyltransferase
VNASTNPGVKIGQNCFIGGGVSIDQDIEGASLVLIDQKLKITKNEKTISMGNRDGMKKKLGK